MYPPLNYMRLYFSGVHDLPSRSLFGGEHELSPDHSVGSLGRDSTNQPLSQGSRTEDGLNGKDQNMAGMFKCVETYQFVR